MGLATIDVDQHLAAANIDCKNVEVSRAAMVSESGQSSPSGGSGAGLGSNVGTSAASTGEQSGSTESAPDQLSGAASLARSPMTSTFSTSVLLLASGLLMRFV